MRFDIEHTTEYHYTEQVRLDTHILRLIPRPLSSVKVISQSIEIDPVPTLRMEEVDFGGNAVIKVAFDMPTWWLKITNHLAVDTLGREIEPELVEDESLLSTYLHRPEPTAAVDAFASSAMAEAYGDPLDFVWAFNRRLNEGFTQILRETGGPYSPATTLELQSGACRDYAVLMMDACRSVGIPARFVSGYQEGDVDVSHRNLHAWMDAYLPGLGWTGYDPTLGLKVGAAHIPLAASALPDDAAPVTGTYWSYAASSEMRCSLALSAR